MSKHVLTPLLADGRLTLPELESSKIAVLGTAAAVAGGLGLMRAAPKLLGKTVGAVKSIPQRMANSSVQNAADFHANANAMAVPKLTPEAAAANAATKMAPPPAAAPVEPAAPGLSNTLSNLSGMKSMGAGAALGGLKGVLDPGTTTDENGNQVQKSRIGAAIGGAATGAAAGALAAPLIRSGAKMHASGALGMPGAKEAPSAAAPVAAAPASAPAAGAPLPAMTHADLLPPAPVSPTGGVPGAHAIQNQLKGAASMLSLPTFPFSACAKTADRVIKHPGSPGPRGTSSDAAYNRATGGPACTNTDAVTSTSKMATADQPASDLGATYNKATGVAPLSGPADLSKGPDGAKAETADHKKREALAKQETSGTAVIHAAPTHTPSGMTAVDREKAVQQFPVLSLRK